MSLWFQHDPTPQLQHGEVLLRAPALADYRAWAALRQTSRDFLQPWEPFWHDQDYSRAQFHHQLRHYGRNVDEGVGYHFFIFLRESPTLVGAINLYDLQAGASMSAALGYWIGKPYARRGYALSALRAVLAFAFDDLQLKRVTAACLPRNAPSRKLLEKCGFSYEGYARSYMQIAGRREDHLLFAILPSDRRPSD